MSSVSHPDEPADLAEIREARLSSSAFGHQGLERGNRSRDVVALPAHR